VRERDEKGFVVLDLPSKTAMNQVVMTSTTTLI
jgi:hypothetical protein